jgi:hypothetical protein
MKSSPAKAIPMPTRLDPDPVSTYLFNPAHTIVTGAKRNHVGNRRHIYIALAAILVSILAAAWAIMQWDAAVQRSADLNHAAVTTQAQIVSRRFEDRGREALSRWFVIYRFTTQDGGKTYQNELDVDQDTYNRWVEGTPILIKYLPSDPALSTFAQDDIAPLDLEVILPALFGPAFLTLLILVWAFWVSLRYTRFERQGQVIKGEVTACGGQTMSGHYHVTLHYKFRTPADRELTGKIMQERDDLKDEELPQKGTPIAVLYVTDKLYRLL